MKNIQRKQLAFLLPSLLGLTAFFLVPLFYCFVFSASRTFGRFRFAGADNYLALMGSKAFRLAYGNTFVLMAGYIAALLILSLLVSYVLENSRGTMSFLAVMSAAMFLPSVLVVRFVGILPGAAENAPRLVFLFIFLWKHAGINALILRSASNRMDPAWREAAMIDGACGVFLPDALPQVPVYLRHHLLFQAVPRKLSPLRAVPAGRGVYDTELFLQQL